MYYRSGTNFCANMYTNNNKIITYLKIHYGPVEFGKQFFVLMRILITK